MSRILPQIDDLNRPFWDGSRDGRLTVQRSPTCRPWQAS